MGNDNPFCSNAGQKCSTTDVVLYKNRAYGPALGGCLTRGPIGQRGGLNLYAAMVNEMQKLFDALGLECVEHSCPGYDEDDLHFCGPPSRPPTPRPHDPHGYKRVPPYNPPDAGKHCCVDPAVLKKAKRTDPAPTKGSKRSDGGVDWTIHMKTRSKLLVPTKMCKCTGRRVGGSTVRPGLFPHVRTRLRATFRQ